MPSTVTAYQAQREKLLADSDYVVDDATGSVYWLEENTLMCAPISTEESGFAFCSLEEESCQVEFGLIAPDLAARDKQIEALLHARSGENARSSAAQADALQYFAQADADSSHNEFADGPPPLPDN